MKATLEDEAARLRERTDGLGIEDFLEEIAAAYRGRLVFASSFGAEDQVLAHLLLSADRLAPIVTLDTGRLPQETYDIIERSREFFGATVHIAFPDAQAVEELVREKGVNLFYDNMENRKACCRVRKVEPLRRALAPYDVWITGMRRSQAPTRGSIDRVEYDATHDMIKLNPLIEWTRDDVWSYLRANELPYNVLHDRGFPSIGCLPCTRAVKPDEDERAGRWWWELPEQKECGIHIQDGKVVRSASTTEETNGQPS